MTSRRNMLKIINSDSLKIYYLLKNNKLKTKQVYEAMFSKNKELISKEEVNVLKKEIDSLKELYTKENCFDEILYLVDKKYSHLKSIRYIVDISSIIDEVVSDKIYLEKLKIHYSDLIIDSLVEDFYDHEDLMMFSKLKQDLIELSSDENHKIIENINRYYIRKITI